MIEKGLNQHNIMPGTERYTRPEEVKALNKFLKSVKETQEEHTLLEEDNLELPRYHEVNDLDSRRISVSGEIKTVDRLEGEDRKLFIKGNDNFDKLPGDLENLKESRENNLVDSKITIEDNRENELQDNKILLDGIDSVDLDDTRLELTDDSENELENTRLTIDSSEINDLSGDSIKLEKQDDVELEDYQDTLNDARENSLEDLVLGIDSTDLDELGKYRINIKSPDDIDLENHKETITGKNVTSLPKESELNDTRLKITGEKINNLPDEKEKLEVPDINTLDDYRENIEDQEIENLETHKENIGVTTNIDSLENHLEKLDEPGEQKLDYYIDKIEDENEPILHEDLKTISPEENNNLSREVKELEAPDTNNLENYKENIEGKEIETLSSNRENIESKDIDSLSDEVVTVKRKEVSGLPDKTVSISSKEINNLPDETKELEVQEISALENRKENIEVQETENLSVNRENIDSKDIDSLSDKIETLDTTNLVSNLPKDSINIQDKEISDLDNNRIELNSAQDINSLPGELKSISPENDINNLEDHKETIETSEIPSLETTVLSGPEEIERDLDTTKLDIQENSISSLDNTLISGPTTNNPESLEDKIITGEANDVNSLENFILGLNYTEDNQLESKIIKEPIENDPDTLGNTKISLDKPEEQDLETYRENLVDQVDNVLEDILVGLRGVNGHEEGEEGSNFYWEDNLGDKKIITPESSINYENELIDDKLIISDNVEHPRKTEGLSDRYNEAKENLNGGKIDRPLDPGTDGRTITSSDYKLSDVEIKDTLVDSPDNIEHPRKTEELSDRYKEAEENLDTGKVIKPSNIEHPRKTEGLSDRYKEAKENLDNGVLIRPGETIDIEELPNKTVGEITPTENSLSGKSLDTPRYKLPEIGWKNFWSGGALNPSTYLRWAVDNTVGRIPLKGALKKKLIDETLQFLIWGREALEKLTKANRDRLPGGDMGLLSDFVSGSLSVKSAAKSVVGAVGKGFSKGIDRSLPLNRPKDDKSKQKEWEAIGQYVIDHDQPSALQDPLEKKKEGSGGFFKKLGNSLTGKSTNTAKNSEIRRFTQLMGEEYIADSPGKVDGNDFIGLGKTVSDLINNKEKEALTSLEDFKKALKESRYITTPEKFTTTKDSTNYMTLDSNHVWEIIMKPYLGRQNGNVTWLPSFNEMDYQNKSAFNVTTSFKEGWLPITGFELQDKKLTSKELPLFDGSISYPVGLEFTNELRLTFADDSLKTLKRYFDLCTKVSAYMSNIHTSYEPWYGGKITNPLYKTVYLEGKVHPGLYKNLSFLITIFILTPQYGTVKKCNLLCVIKDYTIDNQGETDASPTELSVTFSIVGENPIDGIDFKAEKEFIPAQKTGQTDRTGTGILDNLGSVVDIF